MTTNLSEKVGTIAPYLIDTVPVRFQLVESKSGRPVIRGIFGRVDTPTNNRRVYSEAIMRQNLVRLEEDINRRRVFGELDHPADGRTRLNRVSHIITKLEINENKEIIGTAEILNTDAGRNLRAIIDAGGEVGVSSRGVGTTKTEASGDKHVNEDFRLMTFDVVAEPATSGAYPKFHMEGVGDVGLDDLTAVDLRKHCHDAAAEIARQAHDEGRAVALSEGVTKKGDIEAKVREEMKATLATRLKDMKPAGLTESEVQARIDEANQRSSALESKLEVALAEREAMSSELETTKDMAFKLANSYRMLQLLGNIEESNREAVESLVGDPKDYDSLDELDEAFGNALEDVIENLKKAQADDKRQSRLNSREEAVSNKAAAVGELRQQLRTESKARSDDAERMTNVLGKIQQELSNIRNERDNAISYAENAQRLSGQIMEEVSSRRKTRKPRKRLHESNRRRVREVLSENDDYEDTDDTSLFESVRRHARKTRSVLSEGDEVGGRVRGGGNDREIVPGLRMSEIMPLMNDD